MSKQIHESWHDLLALFQDSGEFTQEKYIEWLRNMSIATLWDEEPITMEEFKSAQLYECDEATKQLTLIWRMKLPFKIDVCNLKNKHQQTLN